MDLAWSTFKYPGSISAALLSNIISNLYQTAQIINIESHSVAREWRTFEQRRRTPGLSRRRYSERGAVDEAAPPRDRPKIIILIEIHEDHPLECTWPLLEQDCLT